MRNSPEGTWPLGVGDVGSTSVGFGRGFTEERGHERRGAADHVIEHTLHVEVGAWGGVVELIGVEEVDELDESWDDDGELV